ncbi:MAG: glycosyltransferase family 2 protein [Hyphomicrobiaceae bacterium]
MSDGETGKRVAVIVPAADAAATIGEMLASVLAQSLPACEVVVVDDGSRDDTVCIVRAIAATHPSVRLVRQSRQGPSSARNAGIAATQARLIAPIDADDVWHPDYLALCVPALEAQAGASMVYARHHLINASGRTVRGPMPFSVAGGAFGPMLLTNFVGNGSSAIFLRDAVIRAGGYAPPLADWAGAEDYLLQLRVAAHGDVVCVARDLVGYRKSDSSLSSDHARAYRGRLAAVERALAETGPAPRGLLAWVRGDACRTLAFQLLREHRAWQAALLLWEALWLDWRGLLRDIVLRLRNFVRRALGLGTGGEQVIDRLLARRLDWLAQAMPHAPSPSATVTAAGTASAGQVCARPVIASDGAG